MAGLAHLRPPRHAVGVPLRAGQRHEPAGAPQQVDGGGRLSQIDAGVAEHERRYAYLEQMVVYDQPNSPDIASAETVRRGIQVQEERWRERFVTDAGESMDADLFYGTSRNRGNARVHPRLLSHVSAAMATESAISEERRKVREERQSTRVDARGNNNKKGERTGGRMDGGPSP